MPLISSATRFCANGQAEFCVACSFSAATRASPATSTRTPPISGLALNVVSLLPSVPPPGSVVLSATFDESVRMSVRTPVSVEAVRGVSVVSVTPAQEVVPLVTLTVNWLLVVNAPPRPLTRT